MTVTIRDTKISRKTMGNGKSFGGVVDYVDGLGVDTSKHCIHVTFLFHDLPLLNHQLYKPR